MFFGTSPLDPELCRDVEVDYAPGVYLNIDGRDPGHREIVNRGYTQRKLSKMLCDLCLQGRIFLDIGANYGYFTCLWAAANPANRILAFEPNPRNFEFLKKNIEKNCLAGQVELTGHAVGREYGIMPFFQGPEERTSMGRLVLQTDQKTIKTDVVALDEYMKERLLEAEVIQVMKLAAGGAEAWALQGASKLLRSRKIKHVFFWENPKGAQALGIRPLEAHDELHAHGYTLERLERKLWHAFL
jgi:FkbM family methyltransferase